MPLRHWLVGVYYDPRARLRMGSCELAGCPQGHSAGVYGFCCAGLRPGHAGSRGHGGQLVGPVSVHSCQDVVDQRVEMDPGEVRGSAFTPPMFLQDPEEDVTDHAHVGDAIPGRERGVGSRCRLAEEQQLLLVQPQGRHRRKDLLTETQRTSLSDGHPAPKRPEDTARDYGQGRQDGVFLPSLETPRPGSTCRGSDGHRSLLPP